MGVMNVLNVAFLVLGGLSLLWAVTFGFRALLKENSPDQPGDSPAPPDLESPRRRPRVVLGDPRLLSTPLASRSGS